MIQSESKKLGDHIFSKPSQAKDRILSRSIELESALPVLGEAFYRIASTKLRFARNFSAFLDLFSSHAEHNNRWYRVWSINSI